MVTSRILGPDGQPIVLADLQEQQSSNIAWLHHNFQGHPARGLTPSKLASIMQAAEQGDLTAQCELWEDIEERDAHIMSELGKRRRALLAIDWDIVPPANASGAEKKAARKLKELLNEVEDLEDLIFDVTDAIGKGYVGLEMPWHQVDGMWLPQCAIHREQAWLQIARIDGKEELRLRNGSPDGEQLRPCGWITHVHKAKSGYLGRSSLFRCLVWPYLFKNYAIGDLAEFLEIYGIPLRIGKYPPGSSEKDKATLLRALASIGHNAAGIIPDGMMLDFHDAATGDPDAYMAMVDWCEKSQSKAILGGTLTSQADGKTSTNALGQVHNEVRHDLRDADARQIQRTLSRDLVYPIAVLNGLAQDFRRCPRFVFDLKEPEDITAYAENLPALVNLGFRIDRQWAQEQVGIPEPEEGAEILTKEKAAAPNDPAAPGPGAPIAAATAENTPATADVVDLGADALMVACEPAIRAWVKAMLKGVDAIAAELPPETVLDGLAMRCGQLQGELDLDAIALQLAQAMTVAQLAGRAAIQELVDAELSGAVAVATAQTGGGVIDRGWEPAAQYFAQKINLPTQSWRDLWQGQHARAFVVAGATRDALLQDLREAVRGAIQDGTSFETFRKNFEALVLRNRWTGWTGETTDRGRLWRARVIYKTNLRTAHAAGRYRQMTDPAVLEHMPYWRYRHNTLLNPRETHVALNGLVLRWDDPWWARNYPPNGWGCDCDVVPMSERQLRKMGKTGPDRAPIQVDDDPPPEWAYNVGETAWGKPAADALVNARGFSELVPLDSRGPSDFGRGELPFDTVGIPIQLNPGLGSRELFRRAIGAESTIVSDPVGSRINVTSAGASVSTMDYLQLLLQTISTPAEVWVSFAENASTGKVELVRSYVRAFALQSANGRIENVVLRAETARGQWIGLDAFNDAARARRGFLIWGRKP